MSQIENDYSFKRTHVRNALQNNRSVVPAAFLSAVSGIEKILALEILRGSNFHDGIISIVKFEA